MSVAESGGGDAAAVTGVVPEDKICVERGEEAPTPESLQQPGPRPPSLVSGPAFPPMEQRAVARAAASDPMA